MKELYYICKMCLPIYIAKPWVAVVYSRLLGGVPAKYMVENANILVWMNLWPLMEIKVFKLGQYCNWTLEKSI